MAASDEIKEAIVQYYDCTNVQSKKSDWKRVDKRTLATGDEFREFHNAKLNRTIYVIGNEEDAEDGNLGLLEKDQILYGFADADSLGEDSAFVLVFETQDRFLRTGHLYDQHQTGVLGSLWNLYPDLDEVSENQFVADKAVYNDLTVHIKMKKLGFKFSRELTDWSINHVAPTSTSGGPDLSVVPPVLDPNYSAPLQPANNAKPAPSGKTTKFTNKMPGQVAAQQAATHQAQQAAMMAAIGQMAGQLGATGGVQIGNTHIPAMQPLTGVPPLPPSGMFNSPGMQAAIPAMTSGYPELANLQPAVQAAFLAQRVLGHKGLDQADPNWMDKADVEKLLMRHRGQQFHMEIERSNAIWMLYEETDDGSGHPLEDLFALDNEDLWDTLDVNGIFDQIDYDEHDVEIIDDRQVYPAPYDLPVPQPAPPAPMPAQQRPAPMVGPASVNARAGSFAALPAAPAAVAPPPPPAGNAKAHIGADSGDKWPEFCKEVWDTYEINKINLPLDLNWYDRYRPREEQITGLGYKFVRREFTGVVVKMGYLDREGELIETIDLPSAVLEELLKEWGGDWNIDDITQLINKRKGEDPETGFSYSSEGTWDEVKTFLDSEDWKEAK